MKQKIFKIVDVLILLLGYNNFLFSLYKWIELLLLWFHCWHLYDLIISGCELLFNQKFKNDWDRWWESEFSMDQPLPFMCCTHERLYILQYCLRYSKIADVLQCWIERSYDLRRIWLMIWLIERHWNDDL